MMRTAAATLAALLFACAALGQQVEPRKQSQDKVDAGPVYEVELIVFRQRGAAGDWAVVGALRDFRELPVATRTQQSDPENDASPTMETTWRKLETSSDYQPLQYLHWRTVAGSYEHPRRWRVHGPQPLNANHPALSGNLLPEWVAAGPPLSLLRRHAYSPLRPGPELHFRLDGMFSLAADPGLTVGLEIVDRRYVNAMPRPDDGDDTAGPAIEYQQIHQRRRIETERLEYFDTPALAALLWVRQIEMKSKPAPQEPVRMLKEDAAGLEVIESGDDEAGSG